MKSELNEYTHVPLGWIWGLIVVSVTVFGGGTFWLTTLYTDVASAKAQLIEVKTKVEILEKIDKRLSRIEWRLGITNKGE